MRSGKMRLSHTTLIRRISVGSLEPNCETRTRPPDRLDLVAANQFQLVMVVDDQIAKFHLPASMMGWDQRSGCHYRVLHDCPIVTDLAVLSQRNFPHLSARICTEKKDREMS